MSESYININTHFFRSVSPPLLLGIFTRAFMPNECVGVGQRILNGMSDAGVLAGLLSLLAIAFIRRTSERQPYRVLGFI